MAELDDFQRSCLDAHNKLRTERGVPALRWCDDVATSSLNWAQNLSEKGYLQHSDNPVLGENVSVTTEDQSGASVVDRWLEEEAKYNYELERWQRGTSRFTQMLWRSSTEFGVAKVPLKGKAGFAIVANYRPRGNGNKAGEYKRNVPTLAGTVNGWTEQAAQLRAENEKNVSAAPDQWQASGQLDHQTASDQPDEISSDQPAEISSYQPDEISSDQPDEISSDQPDEISSYQPDIEITSGQQDSWEASDRFEQQDPSGQPGNEDSWDRLDTEDPSDRLDTEDPSDRLDNEGPSDRLDNEDPSDRLDTEDPSDRLDNGITSEQPGKGIASDGANGEYSTDRLDNGNAAFDQYDDDDLADVPNGMGSEPTDVQEC